jgi:hypothetical protein
MMKLLAQAGNDPFVTIIGGTIAPIGPGGDWSNPSVALAKFIGFLLQLFIFGSSLVVLAFLLWGAFDWITSGGEKDKIAKAQQKITNAVIGFILIFVLLSIFGVITGDILGVMKKGPHGEWLFVLPTL